MRILALGRYNAGVYMPSNRQTQKVEQLLTNRQAQMQVAHAKWCEALVVPAQAAIVALVALRCALRPPAGDPDCHGKFKG